MNSIKILGLALSLLLISLAASAARPMVAGGNGFTFFLSGGGVVSAVGMNDVGQLGQGAVSTSPPYETVAAAIGSLTDIVQVAGGDAHAIALKRDGTVYTWGRNATGQLGLGAADTTDRHQPTKVTFFDGLAAGNEVIAVVAGSDFSVAVTRGGDVYTWGGNTFGQLGNGDNAQQNVPVHATTLVAQVAAGSAHVVALKFDSSVIAWGKGTDGQLGDVANSNRNSPVAVSGLTSIVKVAAGGNHSLAVRSDGGVRAWGLNASGQLGTGDLAATNTPATVLTQLLPGPVALAGIVDVAAGANHSLAIANDSRVYTWGADGAGQLGNDDPPSTDSPLAAALVAQDGITGAFAWASANVSFLHRSNATHFGALLAFGDNTSGQLWLGANGGASGTPQYAPALITNYTTIGAPGAKSGQRTNFKKPGVSRSDLLWRNAFGVNVAWDFTSGTPPGFTAYWPPGVDTSWTSKGTADVNGDGISDILWFQPSTGQVVVWLMGGPGTLGTGVFLPAVGAGSPWAIQGAGDLDGDGRADIVWRNTATGELTVWYMRGEAVIDESVSYGIVPLNYALKGLADVNGDWRQDLVWFESNFGGVVVWQMTPLRTFTAAYPASVGASSWRIYRLGDFDGDGRDDILWRNTSDSTSAVWYMKGGSIAHVDFLPTALFSLWTDLAVGDTYGLGRDDVIWMEVSGVVYRWIMQGRGANPIGQTIQGVGPGWSAIQ